MSCFVKTCKNIRRLTEDDISFHRIPKDPKKCKKWLEAIGRTPEEFAKAKTRFVCSDHFTVEDYIEEFYRAVLNNDAVPHVLPPPNDHTYANDSLDSPPPSPVNVESIQNVPTSSQENLESTQNLPSSLPENLQSTQNVESDGIEGDDSSNVGEPIKVKKEQVLGEHAYCVTSSILERKLTRYKSKRLNKTKLYVTQLREKVVSLRGVIKDLIAKDMLSTNAVDHLSKTIKNLPPSFASDFKKC